ncbi:MAG: response regulator transcription factor [Ginsengibacter sp.]
MTTVALVDDHVLLRNSLAKIIGGFEGFNVLFEADNGQHFIEQLTKENTPDVVLLDINMPVMNGYETAAWIRQHLHETKVLVLSMLDGDTSVIKMINLGARGYILKDSKPAVLKEAFMNIVSKGFYSNDLVSSSMMHFVSNDRKPGVLAENNYKLSEKESIFIRHACTEMTYKEIADVMKTSPRNIDMYRDSLFAKLDIKSRVGLVLFAIKEGIVKV